VKELAKQTELALKEKQSKHNVRATLLNLVLFCKLGYSIHSWFLTFDVCIFLRYQLYFDLSRIGFFTGKLID